MPTKLGRAGGRAPMVFARVPEWMAEYLNEEAKRRESTLSGLVRLALKQTFFAPRDGSIIPNAGSTTPEITTARPPEPDAPSADAERREE